MEIMERYDGVRMQLNELQSMHTMVPEWAKSEHMEMSVSQKELWGYGRTSGRKKKHFFSRMFR